MLRYGATTRRAGWNFFPYIVDPVMPNTPGLVVDHKAAILGDGRATTRASRRRSNWCGWCIEFDRFCKTDTQIDSLLNSSFVLYHLNWSKENENKSIFAQYGYPQRFGFPVFIILNAKGERIHTQNSAYLEDGKKSYTKEKVLDFLEMWTPRALYAASYKN